MTRWMVEMDRCLFIWNNKHLYVYERLRHYKRIRNWRTVIEMPNVYSTTRLLDFRTSFIRERESKVFVSTSLGFCFLLCISSFPKPDADSDRFRTAGYRKSAVNFMNFMLISIRRSLATYCGTDEFIFNLRVQIFFCIFTTKLWMLIILIHICSTILPMEQIWKEYVQCV